MSIICESHASIIKAAIRLSYIGRRTKTGNANAIYADFKHNYYNLRLYNKKTLSHKKRFLLHTRRVRDEKGTKKWHIDGTHNAKHPRLIKHMCALKTQRTKIKKSTFFFMKMMMMLVRIFRCDDSVENHI